MSSLLFFFFFLQVVQLKLDGVAFRLIPESSQVKNALRVSNLFTYSYDKISILAVLSFEFYSLINYKSTCAHVRTRKMLF